MKKILQSFNEKHIYWKFMKKRPINEKFMLQEEDYYGKHCKKTDKISYLRLTLSYKKNIYS